MIALVIDTETTGVDENAEVAEICFAALDIERAKIRSIWSECIEFNGENAAIDVNGIPKGLATIGRQQASEVLKDIASRVDVIVAHNASFDRRFLPEFDALPWVCTLRDYPWPGLAKTGNLASLALHYGVGLVRAHRAFDDVLTLATVLERQGPLLEDQMREAMRRAAIPRYKAMALVTIAHKDLAKNAGFRWDPLTKMWWKDVTDEEAAGFPFKVSRLKTATPPNQ